MHSFTTITAVSALGSLRSPALALPAASPPFIVDPAAVTAATVVPVSANPVVSHSDSITDSGTGQATVLNHCGFPVYLYACSQTTAGCSAEVTLAAAGGTYAETFSDASSGGRSLEIGTTSKK